MRASLLLSSLLLAACGHQDGIVGVARLGEGGASMLGAAGEGAGAGGPPSATFSDEFAKNDAVWAPRTPIDGAATSFGEASVDARDGNLLELTLPGHPEYVSRDQAGAHVATEVGTRERFQFGVYRTRLRFGSCGPREEAVMAFLGYFNDGEDRDGDGIVDDLELDMQVTCGAPGRIYLTVYTDYEDSAQGGRFRKLSRVVDFADGTIFDTRLPDDETFAQVDTDSSLIAPSLFAPDALYELGFEWHRDSVRFFLTLNGEERDLWTLEGADRVPQQPVHIVYNLWHPEAHWYPSDGAADYPANDVVMSVDWVSFVPE